MRENALLDFFNPIIISQGKKIVKGTIGENGWAGRLGDVFLGLCPKPQQGTRSLHPFFASRRSKPAYFNFALLFAVKNWLSATQMKITPSISVERALISGVPPERRPV